MADSNFNWLYPDLMSKNELISVLQQRFIKGESLDKLEKPDLVELYNKYIIPLPQRTYRINRRGREMKKKQIIASKKRKSITSSTEDQPEAKRKSAGKLLTSFDLPSSGAGDRLKPPPSCVNFEHKKIKLSSTSSSSKEHPLPSLDRLKINKDTATVNIDKQSPKKIRLTNNSDKQSPKKIRLTNGSVSTDSQDTNSKSKDNRPTSPMDCSLEEDGVKKKISKISWP